MRRICVVLGLLMAFNLFSVSAEAFIDASLYSVTLDVQDELVAETVAINFTTTDETIIELRLTADPKNLVALVDDKTGMCEISNDVGVSVLTCNLEKSGNHQILINYETTYSLVDLNTKMLVRHNHFPLFNSDIFKLMIELPEGGIIQNIEQDAIPQPGDITSDGKRLILTWSRNSMAEPFGVSVLFETAERTVGLWYFIGVALLVPFIIAFVFRKRMHKIFMQIFGKEHAKNSLAKSEKELEIKHRELVYPDLLESEQKVVEAMKANLNVLKQKDLVKITGFSKAKMSRLLKQMEARKIIYAKPYGNSKKIYLVTKKIKN